MKKLILTVPLLAAFALSGCSSCESYYTWRDMGPVPEGIARKAFWSKECRSWAALLKGRAVASPEVAAAGEFAVESEPSAVSRTYPSRDVIQLEKTTPKDVQLGAVFDYSIKVTNLTDMPVEDVVVMERIPNGFNFTSASPAATKNGSMLAWELGTLAPKAVEEITVSGFATNAGSLTNRATVSYAVPARADVRVLQAVLQLVKTAPPEVFVCEAIPVTFVLTNAGNGTAEDVKIVEALPEGLLTEDGKRQLTFEVGTLGPGQSKEFTASLRATKAGTYETRAVATSSIGLEVESEGAPTAIRQPVLAISNSGPERQYIGRSVTYEITVVNTGDGVAKHTIIEDTIPPEVTSITASNGGVVSGSKVTWQLGAIAPNEYKTVSISYTAQNARELSHSATATAYCAAKVSATAETSVVGVPAILLEVIDVGDPVEVGGQGTYVITATNQGSAPASNIRIVCVLEDKMQCLSLSGATAGTAEGGVITFAPLPSLAPRTKAIWRVVTRAETAGDVLFKVSMTMDEFARPIEETESTNLYK